jgi:hypothetical protein
LRGNAQKIILEKTFDRYVIPIECKNIRREY